MPRKTTVLTRGTHEVGAVVATGNDEDASAMVPLLLLVAWMVLKEHTGSASLVRWERN